MFISFRLIIGEIGKIKKDTKQYTVSTKSHLLKDTLAAFPIFFFYGQLLSRLRFYYCSISGDRNKQYSSLKEVNPCGSNDKMKAESRWLFLLHKKQKVIFLPSCSGTQHSSLEKK